MSITALFKKLGAPLYNSRWSWGAVRPVDGAVFLRVWRDEDKQINGRYFVRLTHNAYGMLNYPHVYGYLERIGHVALVRGGAVSYMVMCVARDENAIPREIQSFDSTVVFSGGELIEYDGESWLERKNRVPVRNAQAVIH